MAKSGLYAIRSARATFNVAGSSASVDLLTGNTVAAPVALAYDLYLEAASELREEKEPGVNYNQGEYTGNCVNPKITDPRLRPGTSGTVTMNGRTFKCRIKDLGAPYGTTGLIGSLLCNSIGTPITIEVEQ